MKSIYFIERQAQILRLEMISRYLARKVSRAEYDSRVRRINLAEVNTCKRYNTFYYGDDEGRPE